jgi:hypothetical protein
MSVLANAALKTGANGLPPVASATNITINDHAYTMAEEIRHLVTLFYETLGGESKSIDWTKIYGAANIGGHRATRVRNWIFDGNMEGI